MNDTPSSSPLGGGILLAIGSIGGAIVGTVMGQPSIGLVAGVVLGALGATAIWLWDKARH